MSISQIGEEGWGVIWPHSNWYKPYGEGLPPYVPRFQIIGQYGQQATHWYQHPNGNASSAKLSQQRGAHYLKMGVDTRRSGGQQSARSSHELPQLLLTS